MPSREIIIKRNSYGSLMSGFLIGGLIGAGVALLTAPQSGAETRAIIGDKANEMRDRAMEKASETRDKAGKTLSSARDQASDMINKTKDKATSVVHSSNDMVEIRKCVPRKWATWVRCNWPLDVSVEQFTGI